MPSADSPSDGGNKFIQVDPTFYQVNIGFHRVPILGTAGVANLYEFIVPSDFNNLVKATVSCIPSANIASSGKDIDLFSDYAGLGEPSNQHSESDVSTVYDFTGLGGDIAEFSVASVLSALAAGDRVGLRILHNTIGGDNRYLNLLLEYN